MEYTIPVLFIFFNRKDVAINTFVEIRKRKPKILYLASDGPRTTRPAEALLIDDIRNTIINMVDWDCKLNSQFQNVNLGCGNAVMAAINWLFTNEKMGIIIEDDCLVNSTFFDFMHDLLWKYKDDSRIGFISGFNPLGYIPSNDSYCFSKYMFSWGWATWERSWANMDYQMNWRNTEYKTSILENIGYNGKCIKENKIAIKYIDKEYINTWDHQWRFSLASINQLCILPAVNLVSNIGTAKDATHTSYSFITMPSTQIILPLTHPKYILPNSKMDFLIYKLQNTLLKKIFLSIPYPTRKLIKKILLIIK